MESSILTEVFLPLALALIMLGMGVTLTLDDFRRVVRFPKAVAIGLVAQIVLLPLLGWALVQVLPLSYGLAVGLMILALCPGGPTASLITFLARGDAALSVTLTATSSLITLVTTPLGLFLVLQAMQGQGAQVQLPLGQTLLFLFVITLIPVSVGMAIKAKRPKWATAAETPFKLFGLVVLVLIIAAALIKERNNVVGFFAQAGIAALLLNVLALAMGAGVALAARLTRPQAVCVAIDTGNCNGTLSVAIAATILKQPEMAITPAVYSLIMLALGGAAVFVVPRIGRRVLRTEPVTEPNAAMLLRRSVERFGDKVAMQAVVDRKHQPVTYRELWGHVRRYAAGYRALGLRRGDRVAILSENSAEWAYADWAAHGLGLVTVPIFPTLTADTVVTILRDSGASTVLCGSAEQMRKCKGIEGVRSIRLTGPDSFDALASEAPPLSDEDWNREVETAGPEDLATLIYTSGTTGEPKGVMLPERVFTHVADSARLALPFDQNEVFLSFLPMSHVYERFPGQVLPLSLGATIVYSRGLASLSQEMQDFKPSVMLCVPRFLEATMDRIVENSKKLPWLDRKLFDLALAQGVRKARGKFAPLQPVLDLLVLANVRDRLGGNFRYFASGGAALPTHVAEFYLAIGLTILQGYGLTETGGASFVNRPKRNRYWTAGEPVGTEVKIAEDGEILLRGKAVMQGYYNRPEDTAAVLDAEGWFATGDIGDFTDGFLRITDRKKDLFKLSNGKYIAPQPIENRLKQSAWVQEAVVFGDGQEYVTALIVPHWDLVRAELGAEGVPEAMLAERDDVRALLKQAVDQANQGVAPFELIKRFSLLDAPFSIDSGELTPTLKVKRRVVKERFAAQIAALVR